MVPSRMNPLRIGTVAFITSMLMICTTPNAMAADPTLTQTEVSYEGNKADENSSITWAPTKAGVPYKANSHVTAASAMDGLYSIAHSFVNSVFMQPFPFSLLEDLLKGKIDISTQYMEVIKPFAGFLACLIVGILFIFIFTITGCCFACCRCCNFCGGKKLQKIDGKTSCRRHVYGLILFIITAFTAVGMICSFVNTDRMNTSITGIGGVVKDSIDDFESFLNNTVEQVEQTGVTNFEFLKKVLYRDLDSVGSLVGVPLRNEIYTSARLDEALQAVKKAIPDINETFTEMNDVVTSLNTLTESAKILQSNLSDISKQIKNADPNFDTSALNASFDSSTLPNISNELSKMDSLRKQDFNALLASANEEINNIPERVVNESKTPIQELKKQIDSFSDQIAPFVQMVSNFSGSVFGMFNISDIKNLIDNYVVYAQQYSKYGWYGGVGLSSILLLVVMLQLLGLLCGACGGKASDPPTKRGCPSNSGGNMLMAATGFIFIFSWLFMLLTLITFLVGAPLEKYVCQTIEDPKLELVAKALYKFNITQDERLTFSVTVRNKKLNISGTDILQKFQAGQGLVAVLDLEGAGLFNLTQLTDYRSKINISGQLDQVSPDFSSINVLPKSLRDQLTDFRSSVAINFTEFHFELSKNTTNGDLNEFIQKLNSTAEREADPVKKDVLQNLVADLAHIRDNEYQSVVTNKENLNNSVANLEAFVTRIPKKIDDILVKFNQTNTILHQNGYAIAKSVLTRFADRLFGVVDTFVSHTKNAINNDIGKCTPLYDIYNSLLVRGVCGSVVDSWNGIWFSMGWCLFFFVPGVIFAVKLAKHYRRMEYEDGFDSDDLIIERVGPGSKQPPPYYSSKPPLFTGNKVGHADSAF